jgi:hypothetical protein
MVKANRFSHRYSVGKDGNEVLEPKTAEGLQECSKIHSFHRKS